MLLDGADLVSLAMGVVTSTNDIPPGKGVQTFGVSGPCWKKKSYLGPHIKYSATHNHTDTHKSHKVLNKFMILCWATFIAILRHMGPVACRLDTPGRIMSHVAEKQRGKVGER